MRADLIATLQDLRGRADELRTQATAAQGRGEALQGRLQDLDVAIQPQDGNLEELVEKRAEIEASLGLHEQLTKLERMRRQIVDEAKAEVATAATGLGFETLREFSTELQRRLTAWGFPEAQTVRYDRSEQDIIAGDQLRSAHGKGVRAILHAAFTLSLAQYCFDRDIPHPGFVVLDSPLVTYRPPDPHQPDLADDEGLPRNVVSAFYRDIQQQFGGQVIVMENTAPPEPLNANSTDIIFTKTAGRGRYGFFPTPRGSRDHKAISGR